MGKKIMMVAAAFAALYIAGGIYFYMSSPEEAPDNEEVYEADVKIEEESADAALENAEAAEDTVQDALTDTAEEDISKETEDITEEEGDLNETAEDTSEAAEDTSQITASETPEDTSDDEETKEEIKQYYKYKVTGVDSRLLVRKKPSKNAKVIRRILNGAVGYVLDYDDSYSLIEFHGFIGYVKTKYLSLKEVDESEVPEEFILVTGDDAGKTIK